MCAAARDLHGPEARTRPGRQTIHDFYNGPGLAGKWEAIFTTGRAGPAKEKYVFQRAGPAKEKWVSNGPAGL